MAPANFLVWLSRALDQKGLDGDVFAEYIVSLLESGEDVLEWLNTVHHDDMENADFARIIQKYFLDDNMMLMPENESSPSQAESEPIDAVNGGTYDTKLGVDDEHQNAISIENMAYLPELDGSGLEDLCSSEFVGDIECSASVALEEYSSDQDDVSGAVDYAELADYLEEYFALCQPFPVSFSLSAIFAALTSSSGDVSHAISLLQHALQLVSVVQSKPCRHILQTGRCLRSDCVFDHSFQSTPCKFWLWPGGCSAGHACVFMHDLPPLPNALESYSTGTYNPAVDSKVQFPSLSSSNNGRKHITSQHTTVLHSASYRTALEKMSPEQHGAETARGKIVAGTNATGVDGSYGTKGRIDAWVQSGESVSRDYAFFRQEARTIAIARNKLLEQATQAYLRGAKDVARDLSREGRLLNMRMKELHAKAAQAIFSARNSAQSVFSSHRLDLHGLHAAETVQCLHALLPEIYRSRGTLGSSGAVDVSVITGTGHHSSGRGAGDHNRIYNAATSVCDEWGIGYSRIRDPNGYIGGIVAHLREDLISYDEEL